ncbi:MAG TPA: hypothetical protein VEV65_05600 [Kineosporiaceae bacterium]|nr:hypothetical protein [Kineosporiaceae bacterium]
MNRAVAAGPHRGSGGDDHVVVDHGAVDAGAALDPHARQQHRVGHRRAVLDHDTGGEDAPADRAGRPSSACEQAALDVRPGGDDRGGVPPAAGVDRPGGVVEPERRLGGQEVEVRLPVRVDRADVAPVALEGVCAGHAVRHEVGQQAGAEVLQALLAGLRADLLEPVEHRAGREHEDLVGDEVARPAWRAAR